MDGRDGFYSDFLFLMAHRLGGFNGFKRIFLFKIREKSEKISRIRPIRVPLKKKSEKIRKNPPNPCAIKIKKIEIMQEYAYVNGQILPIANATIHITDLALLRGYGLFDFFKAIDGQPIYMEDHLDRFENSARKLHLELPYTREHLREHIIQLTQLNRHKLLGIKLLCTGGYSEDGYTPTLPNVMMLAKPFVFAPAEKKFKLMLHEHQRELSDIKSINYLTPIAVLPKMKLAGADDVLYHFNGIISESSRSNIFIVKDEKIITPKANILFGITRKHILNVAKKGFDVEERDVTVAELLAADEVFMSGSTKRVSLVERVDNQSFTHNKVSLKLLEMLVENEMQLQ